MFRGAFIVRVLRAIIQFYTIIEQVSLYERNIVRTMFIEAFKQELFSAFKSVFSMFET